MNTLPIVEPPDVNESILDTMMFSCFYAVCDTAEANKLEQLNNLVHTKLEGLVDDKTHDEIEKLFGEISWLFGTEMFKAGLTLGLNPRAAYKLPYYFEAGR